MGLTVNRHMAKIFTVNRKNAIFLPSAVKSEQANVSHQMSQIP